MSFPALGFGNVNLASLLLYFGAGFLVAEHSGKGVVRAASSGGKWIVWLLLMVFVRGGVTPSSPAAVAIQCVALFMVVAHLYGPDPSVLRAFLSNAVSRYFGRLSYSLYLWNVPMLYLLGRLMAQIGGYKTHSLAFGLALGVLSVAAAVPFAHLSERYIERPISKLMKGRVRSRETAIDQAIVTG